MSDAWTLIEGWLSPAQGWEYSSELTNNVVQASGTESLPILPSGYMCEVIRNCNLKFSDCDERLQVNPISSFEAFARMLWRAWRTWSRLSCEQRKACGLTLWRIVADLPAAYRIATLFRGMSYASWVRDVDTLSAADRERIGAMAQRFGGRPRFVILLPGGDDAGRAATLASLDEQAWRDFVVVDDLAGMNLADDWLMVLQPGDRLADQALVWFASEINTRPEAAFIYADDDELDGSGRRVMPRFKPDWSLIHLRETDFIGRAVALRGSAVMVGGGLGQGSLHELLLRMAEQGGDAVAHIPAVLLHRAREKTGSGDTARADVCRRMRFDLPAVLPMVSIIIPTRDAVDLLRQCIESIQARTTYQRYEILVVDNGSRDAAALAYLQEIAVRTAVRVLRDERPFNFSAINNFAVGQVQGEVLCLLNNDTEVISPDWLEEMVGHLLQDRVGVVGAKLYYPDGRVQHGGDTVGPGGCANHLHQFIARDDPGYCNRAVVAQELSAVTAACMVTWSSLYMQLGGLNERWLPVAFNDVDYSLRVRQAGRKVIWTPHAELYHHESVSRGRERGWRKELRAWREVRYMRWKWGGVMKNDPFYNPNFSYLRPDFALGPAPNVRPPWR